MKALIILNLEDCTFDEIEEAEIKEINLVYKDKETGNRYEFEWETGFKIIPMPQKKKIIEDMVLNQHYQDLVNYYGGWNACIEAILGGE